MQYIFYENKLPKEAIDIRYKVFTLEQGFAEEVDLDDFDTTLQLAGISLRRLIS